MWISSVTLLKGLSWALNDPGTSVGLRFSCCDHYLRMLEPSSTQNLNRGADKTSTPLGAVDFGICSQLRQAGAYYSCLSWVLSGL